MARSPLSARSRVVSEKEKLSYCSFPDVPLNSVQPVIGEEGYQTVRL